MADATVSQFKSSAMSPPIRAVCEECNLDFPVKNSAPSIVICPRCYGEAYVPDDTIDHTSFEESATEHDTASDEKLIDVNAYAVAKAFGDIRCDLQNLENDFKSKLNLVTQYLSSETRLTSQDDTVYNDQPKKFGNAGREGQVSTDIDEARIVAKVKSDLRQLMMDFDDRILKKVKGESAQSRTDITHAIAGLEQRIDSTSRDINRDQVALHRLASDVEILRKQSRQIAILQKTLVLPIAIACLFICLVMFFRS